MLTEEQIAARRKCVGASDVGSIMGLNPYVTPTEVWAQKTGRLPASSPTKATRYGDLLESTILDYAEDDLGSELLRDVLQPADDGLGFPLAARCDAIYGSDTPVEAKTAGLTNPRFDPWNDWGDEDTDLIPDQYFLQVTAQMMATGADKGYLYALISGRGFCRFVVHRSDKIVEAINETCSRFWEHVQRDERPDDDRDLSLESLKRIHRDAHKVKTLDSGIGALLDQREYLKKQKREIEGQLRESDRMILLSLEDAESGLLPDGRQITYYQQQRAGYTVEPVTYRTLRVKKGDRK